VLDRSHEKKINAGENGVILHVTCSFWFHKEGDYVILELEVGRGGCWAR
jgi:hypothetical protein